MKHLIAGASLALALVLAAAGAHAQTAPATESVLVRNDALAWGEPTDGEGRVQRDHPVTLRAGETLDVAMSAGFDAVVRVTGPNGFVTENDDAPGEGTNARLRFTAPAAGVYLITATTYAPGEIGWFSLVANRAQGSEAPATPFVAPTPVAYQPANFQVTEPAAQQPAADEGGTNARGANGGRVFGLFVGVTEYPDGETFRAAEDAADLAALFERRGVIRHGDAIVLTNAEASSATITRSLTNLGTRMTPRDSLVFYFGGHGSVNSMAMPSGSMTAAELSTALDRVPGRQLITLDSCHAGSFEWVVQRSPRRAGLFSSTSSELSYTATSVNSSGWLAYFLLRAAEGQVPAGSDGAVQLDELSSFVRAGYASHSAPQTLVSRAGRGAGNLTLW